MQEFFARVKTIKYLNARTIELAVKLVRPKTLRFRAGQFMLFDIDGAAKAYSITSPPEQKSVLRFCVGLVKGGKASGFIAQLRPGSELPMSGPLGGFVFDLRRRKVCFVAGGAGAAPFLSIIPRALARGYRPECRLILLKRPEEKLIYMALWRRLARHYRNFFVTVLNYEKAEKAGSALGRFLQPQDLQDNIFFVSGAGETVSAVRTCLLKRGVGETRIRSEPFSPPPVGKPRLLK